MSFNERLVNASASSCHCAASRVIVAADKPAADPRNCSNAGPKSLLDRPCKYNSRSTSATCGDFRAHAGLFEERQELGVSVARVAGVGDLPGRHLQGRKQGGSAVAHVVVEDDPSTPPKVDVA